MKKSIVIHPFLFALYPILFLYSYNIDAVFLSEALMPLLIASGFTLILFLFLNSFLKSKEKAALIGSLFLLLFFSYGHVYDSIAAFSIGGFEIGRHRYLLLTYLLVVSCGVYLTMRRGKNLNTITSILNAIATILIIFSFVKIGTYGFNRNVAFHDNTSPDDIEAKTIDLTNSAKLPDIYYIILDGYASSSTLEEVYDYDNHEFTDYLMDKGFYIASESRSNYAATFLSLASSLNMEYVNYLSDVARSGSDNRGDRTAPYQMISYNKVMRFLKSIGYKYVHFESGWAVTSRNEHADLAIQCSRLDEFHIILIQTTMLKPFSRYLIGDLLRERILCTFSKLAEVQHMIEGPRFVFAHIGSPHPPFVFGPNGERLEPKMKPTGPTTLWKDKQGYLDQLVFVNKKVKVLVEKILSEADTPPVIILQGDHGPAATGNRLGQPNQTLIKERMRILNAYYLPNISEEFLYDSITPVNSFRLIFNSYFNTGYDLLDDKSYYSRFDQPYNFIDVTEILIEK